MNKQNQRTSKIVVSKILILVLPFFANLSYAVSEVCYTSGAYSRPIYGKQESNCRSVENSLFYVSQAYTKGVQFNPSKVSKDQSASRPKTIYVSKAYNNAIFSYQ